MRRPALFLALALILPGSLFLSAQVQVPRVTESIDVRVTNVDVVVTDSTGKRVKGLTRDDFEVFDNRKPQTITNFSEFSSQPRVAAPADSRPAAAPVAPAEPSAAAAAAVTAPPPRHVVIFFDVFSTTRDSRRRLVPALTKLVNGLRPEDQGMVITWNRTLNIVTMPTSDHAALEKAIASGAGEASLRKEALTNFPDRLGDMPALAGAATTAVARQAAEERANARRRAYEAAADLTDSVRALRGVIESLAGADGRKALILVSTAYSFMPAAGEVPPGDDDTLLLWLETLNAPPKLKELADAASAAGVAIYGIQAESMNSGWSANVPGTKVAGINYVNGSDTNVVSAIPESVFSTDIPSLDALRASGGAIGGLTYLAARSGGIAAANSNYFNHAMSAIEDDLGNYYSIGYSTPADFDQKRNIEVRTRDKRYTVRARHSATDRSADAEISDRVTAALLFPTSLENQLDISARAGTIERSRGRMKIPIDVKIPMVNLTFQSGESELLVADLSILVSSSDGKGGLSPVERFHKIIPITRDQLPKLAKSHYTYSMSIDLRSVTQENRFAIAVIDNVSKATGVTTLDVK